MRPLLSFSKIGVVKITNPTAYSHGITYECSFDDKTQFVFDKTNSKYYICGVELDERGLVDNIIQSIKSAYLSLIGGGEPAILSVIIKNIEFFSLNFFDLMNNKALEFQIDLLMRNPNLARALDFLQNYSQEQFSVEDDLQASSNVSASSASAAEDVLHKLRQEIFLLKTNTSRGELYTIWEDDETDGLSSIDDEKADPSLLAVGDLKHFDDQSM